MQFEQQISAALSVGLDGVRSLRLTISGALGIPTTLLGLSGHGRVEGDAVLGAQATHRDVAGDVLVLE